VLDHGRVVATGSPADLKARIGGDRIEVTVADPRRRADSAATAPTRPPDDRRVAAPKRLAAGGSSGSATVTSIRSPPILAFRSAGEPVRDDAAVVEHDDLVGEAIGLVQVLRREPEAWRRRRRAPAAAATGRCATGGRARGRLVENSTGGEAIRLAARSSRRRIPPEKVLTRSPATSVRPTRSSSSSVRRRTTSRGRW